MQAKRFTATDMRRALNKVRSELGENAVILSSRRCDRGIEIIAIPEASVVSDSVLQSEETPSVPKKSAPMPPPEPATPQETTIPPHVVKAERTPRFSSALAAALRATRQSDAKASAANTAGLLSEDTVSVTAFESDLTIDPLPEDRYRQFDDTPPIKPSSMKAVDSPQKSEPSEQPVPSQSDAELQTLKAELIDLRQLLEAQLQQQMQQSNKDQHWRPSVQQVGQRLEQLGLSVDVRRQYLNWAENQNENRFHLLWDKVCEKLADDMKAHDIDLAAAGGIFALIGPTGTGKSTSIAKLATRHVMQSGPDSVALISTDTQRLGGLNQLHSVAAILGIPLVAAATPEQFDQAVAQFADKKLVLIDTAGAGYQKVNDQPMMRAVLQHPDVQKWLVIPANLQAALQQQLVRGFNGLSLQACVLTKLDECGALGDALTTVLRHSVPMAYTTHGQQIPQDITRTSGTALLGKALQLSQLPLPYQESDTLSTGAVSIPSAPPRDDDSSVHWELG